MNGAAPKAAVWGGLKLNGTPLWGENGSKIQDYTGSGKPYAELKLNANAKDPTKFDDPAAVAPYQYFVTDANVFGTNAFYTNVLSLNSSYWDYKNLKPGKNDTYTAHFPYVKTGRASTRIRIRHRQTSSTMRMAPTASGEFRSRQAR